MLTDFLLQIVEQSAVEKFVQRDIQTVTDYFNCHNSRIFAVSVHDVFSVDGGIPALYANCEIFKFLSSQSFLILHTTASCVFNCPSPLYEIISHKSSANVSVIVHTCFPFVLSHITRFLSGNRFLYGLCDIFIHFLHIPPMPYPSEALCGKQSGT